MRDHTVWQFIADELRRRRPVMLTAVIACEKGSPGKTGFKLAVGMAETRGTIGGGVMENDLIRLSRERLTTGRSEALLRKRVHRSGAGQNEASGLICGGSQTVFMLPLLPACLPTVEHILAAIAEHRPAHVHYSPAGPSYHDGTLAMHRHVELADERNWLFRENIAAAATLYIVGGGHVGLALAEVMQKLDFELVLIDDREDSPAMTGRLPRITRIRAPYHRVGKHIIGGDCSFAVIVTAAMDSDLAALKQVYSKNLAYIGLMGTRAKIVRIMSGLTAEEKRALGNLHAPVGIHIGSRTPEEIAISIAAELIRVKNSGEALGNGL